MTPAISVVMPAYNAERHIREAIDSILKQTFEDFEFLIIDDGSIDETPAIILSYNDPRIVRIENDKNTGLSYSFNRGIHAARGKYIARMDADDISKTDRFERQIKFLEENPEVGIVGSIVQLIDEDSKPGKIFKRPLKHIELKWQCLFSIPFVHPSVMGRAEVFKENPFDEALHNSEDYELWSRLVFEKDIKFANLPEALLLYRVSRSSFTQSLNSKKRLASATNTIKNIERYTLLSPYEKESLIKMRQDERLSVRGVWRIWRLYARAERKFKKKENFNPSLTKLVKFLIKHKFKHLK